MASMTTKMKDILLLQILLLLALTKKSYGSPLGRHLLPLHTSGDTNQQSTNYESLRKRRDLSSYKVHHRNKLNFLPEVRPDVIDCTNSYKE